jgi:outer membrane protein assembly factor BamB
VKTELRLSWNVTPGVNRYRLQVSRDDQFADLVFDSAVEGHEYAVKDLPLGKYYWHVAPAAAETGVYSATRVVEITGGTEIVSANPPGERTSGSKPPSKTGWSATTGNVAQPFLFYLRDKSAPDVVGVNSDGMVYAIDAANGVALWTARFRPNAKKGEPTGNGGAQPFQPVALNAANGLQNVLVAFDGGVRAIEGASGVQLWRTALTGRAASGAAGDLNGDGNWVVVVFENNPTALTILDAGTGRVVAQSKLDAPDASVIGAPVVVNSKTEPGVLLALAGGVLDFRNAKGERIRSVKLDVSFTTPPLIVQTPQATLAMIGTEIGLVAVDVATLKPLWRVATEGDAPRGQLTAADMDNDGAAEVVMITRRGRTVVVNTANGKIKWYATTPNRAGTTILTDLNGDGATDVLVAADPASLRGHDGRSGALILGNDKGTINASVGAGDEQATYQTCAYISGRSASAASPLIVCNDPASNGLRADSLSSIK